MSVKCIPPYTPLLYSKTGFAEVNLIFLFLIQNIDCGYSLEPCATIHVLSKNKKNIKKIPMKFSNFTAEKNLCILHIRQVFKIVVFDAS